MKHLITLCILALSLEAIEPLVTPQWLHAHAGDPNLRIVEVSEGDTYTLEHIPGAAHTSIGQWRYDNGTFLSIRPTDTIDAEISRLGIDATTDVVLYAPIVTPKDLLKSTYVYWALTYHGIANVALLDGGLNGWKRAGLPLTSEQTPIPPTAFTSTLDRSKIATIDDVKTKMGEVPMIDARPGDMYLGMTPTPTVSRSGHIPGAMSYPWNYSVDADYLLKPKPMLAALFTQGYGLNPDRELLVYCTGGLETSFNYFVLHGLLGYPHVRLYDASMKEWGNRDDTPITRYRYEMFPAR